MLAGAGSGKTRIVTYRVAHLLKQGVPCSQILAVTFTNKAALEMRERILHLTHQSVLTATFHSLCARILRRSIGALGFDRDFTIYDEDDSAKVLKECLECTGKSQDKSAFKTYSSKISQAKNQLLSPTFFDRDDAEFAEVYKLYLQKLKDYNAVDFDDLLFLTVKLFQEHPSVLEEYQNTWRFLLIDEYQDTNGAQYTLVKLLAEKHGNVFAVGDPDQSIYSWRGANIGNILNFSQDFPGAKMIPLEQNYRSSSTILEAANSLIAHNTSRYEKNLWSDLGPGEKVHLFSAETEREEAEYIVHQIAKMQEMRKIPLQECAIFYRTHFQSRVFEDILLRKRLSYQIIGGLSFYQTREIKDLIAFLRMVQGNFDFLAFTRTINLPKRGLGDKFTTAVGDLMSQTGQSITTCCRLILERKTEVKLSAKAALNLEEYLKNIEALKVMAKENKPISFILSEIIERFGYVSYLKEDMETYKERKENIDELIAKAAQIESEEENVSLASFLEELSLKSSADEKPPAMDTLRLMTIHNSKGLEFRAVFLVGLEEELFPHANSLNEEGNLEEERRLCYVGMTRAKEFLHLSHAKMRYLWGISRYMRPSRFLKEIPAHFFASKQGGFQETAGEFEEGAKVFHKDFGQGIIQRAYKTSIGLTYDVFFAESKTLRSLVAKFAKLTKVQ